MKPILIVEDEANIRGLIALSLRRSGYETVQAKDGAEAADLLEKQMFDLVLLDVMLPEIDGFTLIDYILPKSIPVIYITAKSSLKDRVYGLHLGADDYIVKPFDTKEVIARIKAELLARVESVLRRSGRGAKSLKAFGVQVDPLAVQVTQNGQPVHLTPREYDLLVQLMRSRGVAIYRSVLYERVWGGEPENDTRTLDLHIQRLRQKLGWADKIETVRGVGYKLKKEEV